jgi:hypothetical protein
MSPLLPCKSDSIHRSVQRRVSNATNVTILLGCPQLLDIDPEDEEDEDGAAMDLDANRKGKCAVIKTSTRQVRYKREGFSSLLNRHIGPTEVLTRFLLLITDPPLMIDHFPTLDRIGGSCNVEARRSHWS